MFKLFFKHSIFKRMMGEVASFTSRLPIVVILGATGTGKSKLAVELASRFRGEVISADSMQVYKGLDILTNKVTPEEMKGIRHHLISVVNPLQKFDVVQYRDLALPIVNKILNAGKIPFIVGGTNYYIESLLWHVLIDKHKSEGNSGSDSSNCDKDDGQSYSKRWKSDEVTAFDDDEVLQAMNSLRGHIDETHLKQWSTPQIYSALQKVDPQRALKVHPNDRRKSVRSLQVLFQTGKKHSDLIDEQCKSARSDNYEVTTDLDTPVPCVQSLGGFLRFPNCLCLWIKAPKDILRTRIDKRVDEMVNLGLRDELDSYMNFLEDQNCNEELCFEEGLLQSIGFKEFFNYIKLPTEEKHSPTGDKAFSEGLELLKIVTKQYSRRQLKWINQRFLRPARRQVPAIYALDGSCTESTIWDENVTSLSSQIVEAHILNKLDTPIISENRVPLIEEVDEDLMIRTCDVCNAACMGSVQWKAHLESRRHSKMLQRLKNATQADTANASSGATAVN